MSPDGIADLDDGILKEIDDAMPAHPLPDSSFPEDQEDDSAEQPHSGDDLDRRDREDDDHQSDRGSVDEGGPPGFLDDAPDEIPDREPSPTPGPGERRSKRAVKATEKVRAAGGQRNMNKMAK